MAKARRRGAGVVCAGAVFRPERRGEAGEPVVQEFRQRHPGRRPRADAHRLRGGARSAIRAEVHRLAARSAARRARPAASSTSTRTPSTPGRCRARIAKSDLSFARRRKSALAPAEKSACARSRSRSSTREPDPVRRRAACWARERAALKRRDALIAANPALEARCRSCRSSK